MALVVGFGLLAAATTSACKQPAETKPVAPAPAKPLAKPKPAVLVGSVRLASGQQLPSYAPEAVERKVMEHERTGHFPAVCTPERAEDRTPVRLTPDGKLIGVLVAASEFHAQPEPAKPAVRMLAIRDCRLRPTLLVARIGDVLHVTNETAFPMMPVLPADTFHQPLVQGNSRDVTLSLGGVQQVVCAFSSPCGRTDIIILAHPFGAVTDENGEFRIENFPADETLRVNAWHPLFFDTFDNIRVERGEEKRIELVLTPKPPPEPPKPVIIPKGVIPPD